MTFKGHFQTKPFCDSVGINSDYVYLYTKYVLNTVKILLRHVTITYTLNLSADTQDSTIILVKAVAF